MLILVLTAALPGAAVFARPAAAQASASCAPVDLDQLVTATTAASVIVIGEVRSGGGAGATEIVPAAYLKGAASGEAIRPRLRELPACLPARLEPGQRVLAFFAQEDGVLAWPGAGQVFRLENGRATLSGSAGDPQDGSTTEDELVREIRSITGQYAVPAASRGEGAGIDWRNTLIPVGFATAALFAVGLYLMRIWHRIDPS